MKTSKIEKLRFDGVMRCGEKSLAQFTELDESSPSHGASFYLPSEEATPERIETRRAEKRVQFATNGVR
jgi:hypothetical protein